MGQEFSISAYYVAIIGAITTLLGVITTFFLTRRKQIFGEEQAKRTREFDESQIIFNRHETRIKFLEGEYIKCLEDKANLSKQMGEALGKIEGLTSTVMRLETTIGIASERAATSAATKVTEHVVEKATEVAVNKINEVIENRNK